MNVTTYKKIIMALIVIMVAEISTLSYLKFDEYKLNKFEKSVLNDKMSVIVKVSKQRPLYLAALEGQMPSPLHF